MDWMYRQIVIYKQSNMIGWPGCIDKILIYKQSNMIEWPGCIDKSSSTNSLIQLDGLDVQTDPRLETI